MNLTIVYRVTAEDDITISGAGCRFPGSNTSFQLLINGENHDLDISKTIWKNDVFYAKYLTVPGKMYVKEARLPKGHGTWESSLSRISHVETTRIDQHCVQRCNDILDLVPMTLEDVDIIRKQPYGSENIGDCNMDICGGVRSMISPDTYPARCEAYMMSKKEQWRPFIETAYDYARENGYGVLFLKGPKVILGDGNKIRAPEKTGCNQDGSTEEKRVAIYREMPLQLFKRIYGANDFNPSDTRYIGVHGTGTLREDPTDSNALGERRTCLSSFGVVASNIHAVMPRGVTTAFIMNEVEDNVVFRICIFEMNDESIKFQLSHFQTDMEESVQSIWTDTVDLNLSLVDALILINIVRSSSKRIINIMIIEGNTNYDGFEEICLWMLSKKGFMSELSTLQELQDYHLPHETFLIITSSVVGSWKCKRLSLQKLRKKISLILNLLDNIWISQTNVFPGVTFTLNSNVHVCSIKIIRKAMSSIRKYAQQNGSYTVANVIENSFLLRLPMKSFKSKEVIHKGSLKSFCDKTRLKPY